MNILYIAYSCDPYNGSEDKIGWNVPVESAKTNRVYVITKEEHKETIESYLSEHVLENIKFYFVGIPTFYKKIFKGFMYSGRLNIWNKCVFSLAKKICEENQIDIIHQVTPIEFRAIGDYGKIKGIKFVCGPLGGGEFLPTGLREYIKGHEIIEIIRTIVNYWYVFKFKITRKLKQCDYVMFANKETRDFLVERVKINCPHQLFFDIGLRVDELSMDTTGRESNSEKSKCIFLMAGRMIYRKGHELLLDALTRVPTELDYQCRIVGDGPEIDRLKKKCSCNKNLSQHVVFAGLIPYMEMENEYEKADVFVMPSIRETTGAVLVEAMSKGLPIVAINKFGGAILLDDSTGWLYEGTDKVSYIENLKQAVIDCILEPDEVRRRGRNARKVAEQYTWENKSYFYQKIYCELLDE